jgi:cytochrome c-type biogenesis protein CcmF
MTFILITLFASISLLIFRFKTLKSRNIFEAYLSKETTFLFNNLIFVVLTFILFAGTTFPLISEIIRGYQGIVGPGYYNESLSPLALILVLLMGVCTLIAWRKSSLNSLKKKFLYPIITSLIATSIFFLLGTRDVMGMGVVFVGSFVSCTIGLDFYRVVFVGSNTKGSISLRSIRSSIKRNQRKLGGQIIHISIIIMLIGFAGSSLYETSKMFTLEVGETYATSSYTFKFEGFSQQMEDDRAVTVAMLDISINGAETQRFSPTIFYYLREQTYIRSPHISSSLSQDIYVILQEYIVPQGTQGGEATFTVKTIPLVNFIWFSMLIMSIGTIIAIRSRRDR